MNPIQITTEVWAESGGPILKEALRLEARTWHQIHQPPSRLQDWLKARRKLRRDLLDAAGSFPPAPDLQLREHGSIGQKGYRITKVTYQSRPGLRVTALLFRPAGPGPFPAVLNMHGHWAQGKIASVVARRCQILAKEGFVVLSVDAIGAGERATLPGEFEYHGQHQATSLFSAGETLLGTQLYDNMRGIDLLQSLDDVDGSRIGATGGGNQTLWVSALDERIKASVPVVSIGTMESYVTNYNCWCETLPDALKLTATWELLGLIAPNPLLILTAAKEKNAAFCLRKCSARTPPQRRFTGSTTQRIKSPAKSLTARTGKTAFFIMPPSIAWTRFMVCPCQDGFGRSGGEISDSRVSAVRSTRRQASGVRHCPDSPSYPPSW